MTSNPWRKLTHKLLNGGVVTVIKPAEATRWRLLGCHHPDGRVEDGLTALTSRDLEIKNWKADEPELIGKWEN